MQIGHRIKNRPNKKAANRRDSSRRGTAPAFADKRASWALSRLRNLWLTALRKSNSVWLQNKRLPKSWNKMSSLPCGLA